MNDGSSGHALDVVALDWARKIRDAGLSSVTKRDGARVLTRELSNHASELAEATLSSLASLDDVVEYEPSRSPSEKDQMERPYSPEELGGGDYVVVVDLGEVLALATAQLERRRTGTRSSAAPTDPEAFARPRSRRSPALLGLGVAALIVVAALLVSHRRSRGEAEHSSPVSAASSFDVGPGARPRSGLDPRATPEERSAAVESLAMEGIMKANAAAARPDGAGDSGVIAPVFLGPAPSASAPASASARR